MSHLPTNSGTSAVTGGHSKSGGSSSSSIHNNQSWEASAPVDDSEPRDEAASAYLLPSPTGSDVEPLDSPAASASATTSQPGGAWESVARSPTDDNGGRLTTDGMDDTTQRGSSESLHESVESMWEARRAREDKERLAEQKLIEAVCAASLLEYNEKNRALEAYECELVAKAEERNHELERLRQRREEAERKKREALQRVLDAKAKAAEMSQKVKAAAQVYEQRTHERVEKELELHEVEQRSAQAQALREVQLRKEAAMRRREEAERRAREAIEKAEAMRQRAIEAVQVVRHQSRMQIEYDLTQEEAGRQRQAEQAIGALELEKQLARERKEAAARKAAEAQRRAEELQVRAASARLYVRSSSESSSAASA